MAEQIVRTGKPGAFRYRLGGQVITDEQVLDRIGQLAVPPAWKQVQIAVSARSKVQAVGRDAAGRLQRIYHPSWRAARDRQKHGRVLEFGQQLPILRRAVARDLRRRNMSRQKVVACVIRLMDREFFRVGNARSAQEFGHYGLTTLRRKHVRTTSGIIMLDFIGKSGQHQQRRIRDPQLARLVAQLNEMPGYELFRFVDEGGKFRQVQPEQVNDYLRQHLGPEFSARDFRTWGGTLLTVTGLLSPEVVELEATKGPEAALRTVIRDVAQRLGNTEAVTRSSYIDPRIFELYDDGTTFPELRRVAARLRPRKYLSVPEQCVLRLLDAKPPSSA